MNNWAIRLNDKTFVPYINRDRIQAAITQMTEGINRDLAGKNPVFIVILNGAFLFAADLLRGMTMDCEIIFVKLASYSGTVSTGTIKEMIGLNTSVKDRNVVIVEDIVDTGNTIAHLTEQLNAKSPASVRIATLLFKPKAYLKNISIDYTGFNIPNDFIVGYGLDYKGLGRNLPDIYVLQT
ncbi:MAG TPA: hypoxanthine phosphoribosyltransferase [Bacteroidia bacterium]|nr:hypoxanthine phosphoribosyltransferase [Bacteroidia bacterium]